MADVCEVEVTCEDEVDGAHEQLSDDVFIMAARYLSVPDLSYLAMASRRFLAIAAWVYKAWRLFRTDRGERLQWNLMAPVLPLARSWISATTSLARIMQARGEWKLPDDGATPGAMVRGDWPMGDFLVDTMGFPPEDHRCAIAAAANGHGAVLNEFILPHGMHGRWRYENVVSREVIEAAARNGHAAVIIWLLDSAHTASRSREHQENIGDPYPVMPTVQEVWRMAARQAAMSGKLEVIGALWDCPSFGARAPDANGAKADIFHHAAFHGHRHIIEWVFTAEPLAMLYWVEIAVKGAFLGKTRHRSNPVDGPHARIVAWAEDVLLELAQMPIEAHRRASSVLFAQYLIDGNRIAAARVREACGVVNRIAWGEILQYGTVRDCQWCLEQYGPPDITCTDAVLRAVHSGCAKNLEWCLRHQVLLIGFTEWVDAARTSQIPMLDVLWSHVDEMEVGCRNHARAMLREYARTGDCTNEVRVWLQAHILK